MIILLLSGKRKSGKDYIADKLNSLIKSSQIIRISSPLKKAYANEHDLDYDELMSSGSYKEKYRHDMIKWGEERRRQVPSYFCQLALSEANEETIIVADCRRVTDFEFFINQKVKIVSIRINASDADRSARGYKFEPGVDDAESECGLDSTPHDIIFDNSQNSSFSELEAKLVEFGVIH